MASFEERLTEGQGSLTLCEWESLDFEYENYLVLEKEISPSKEHHLEELTVYDFYGTKDKSWSICRRWEFYTTD